MKKKNVLVAGLAIAAVVACLALAACAQQSSGQTPSMLSNADVERPQSSIDADTKGTIAYVAAVKEATSTPTMDKHGSAGNATCEVCHGEASPTSAPLSDEACKTCHSVASLIEATASYEDIANRQMNPHDSHMHGASCLSCHKNHGESVLACNDCHTNEYDWIVP